MRTKLKTEATNERYKMWLITTTKNQTKTPSRKKNNKNVCPNDTEEQVDFGLIKGHLHLRLSKTLPA